MPDISVSSVNVPTAASMSAQVSARRHRVAGNDFVVPAGTDKDTLAIKNDDKFDSPTDVKPVAKQVSASNKVSALGNDVLTFNQTQQVLASQVSTRRAQELNKQILLTDYEAKAYANHGNKGSYVDFST